MCFRAAPGSYEPPLTPRRSLHEQVLPETAEAFHVVFKEVRQGFLTFLFTGKPDMLFARFEKFVERVYANSPSTLTNIQATNLYARLLSNEPPAPGREAPRTWFMACLSDPASCA